MSKVTVTLEEHEARALVFSSDMGDMLMERLGCRRLVPRGLSPREIAVQKIASALERQERPSGFETLGVPEEPNRHVQRTWDAHSC